MSRSFRHDPRIRTLALAALTLLALSACSPKPAWQADPAALTFSGQVGEAAPPAQTLTLKNAGGGAQPFALSANAGWIHASPTSGDLDAGATASLQVSVEACTEAGTQTGTLTVGGAATLAVEVTRECAPVAGTLLWARQFGSELDDEVAALAVTATGDAYAIGESLGVVNNAPTLRLFAAKHDADGSPVWLFELDPGSDHTSFRDLAVAATGEVYVLGHTYGSLDAQQPNPDGNPDPFLLKLDAEGGRVWLHQFGSPEEDSASSFVLDETNGRLYVAGTTYGDLADDAASYSDPTYFLAAYDTNGAQLWTRTFDRAQDYTGSPLLALDAAGHLVVAGNTYNPTGSVGGRAAWDAFVDEYTPEGVRQWRYDLASDDHDAVERVLTGGDGNVYVFGTTAGSLPGQSSQGDNDAYVLKLNGNGALEWLTQFGSAGSDWLSQGTLDAGGHAYVFGATYGTFDGETSQGDRDLFLAKLDAAAGTVVWTTQFGTSAYDVSNGLGADAAGRLVVSGRTEGSFPGYSLSGSRDPFVAAFDAATGDAVWLTQFSSQDNGSTENRDWLEGFGLDSAGNAYLAGTTQGVYPGESALGEDDAFVIKVQH